jgi:hypothetical protein
MKKLQFHAMNQDDSLMRERLGYALFNEMNVPTARTVHVRLLINGRLDGLYLLVEQVDGRFTRSRFTEGGKGNLYKEIWPKHDDPAAYIAALESNIHEDPTADKILAFKEAIESGGGVGAIDGWLDLDYMMRYIAVDRTIANDDGIFNQWCTETAMGRNPGVFGDPNAHGNHNYYWYEEVDADRLWLIPWDLDHSFKCKDSLIRIRNPWNDSDPHCECENLQMPPACDLLTQHWATLYDRYLEQVNVFLDGPFRKRNVNAKLERWAAQIDEAVREQEGATHNGEQLGHPEWQAHLDELREYISELRSEARQRIR